LDDEIKLKLKQLFESSTKPANEVKEMLIDAIPEMEKVFEVWAKSSFDQFELTSVGIAIAHANYRRKIGDTMDLSIWIK
ncbi:LPO_1073/Vpar_1526 family protein, partial [Vibrio breoganii]|uniref:LPO_1073/Vpar_1526 family protein n=1 Tax=Vibrio breoganii TaxID=553239 RepID=UPI001C2FDF80